MTFTITNDYEEAFIEWLIRRLKINFIKHINDKHLQEFNKILKRENLFEKINPSLGNDIDIRKAILIAVQNLRYRKVKDKYIIKIYTNKKYPNYDVSIVTLCNLLNYGCFSIKAYPLFTDTFNFVTANLNKLYEIYINENFY